MTDTTNTDTDNTESTDAGENHDNGWRYAGLTSIILTKAGPNELGIESVRAIQVNDSDETARAVHLHEEGRIGTVDGERIDWTDDADKPGFREVGAVSNYHDGAEVIGTAYATLDGSQWYWHRWDDRYDDVGDQEGFLPDWGRDDANSEGEKGPQETDE